MIKIVLFELMHTYYFWNEEPVQSPRLLGFFSDKSFVDDAICFYQNVPGFRDSPHAFTVRRRTIHGVVREGLIFEAMVYAHTKDYGFDEYEYTLELGIFSDKILAQEAVALFRDDNRLYYENLHFEIEEIVNTYRIDKRYCTEGFEVELVERSTD